MTRSAAALILAGSFLACTGQDKPAGPLRLSLKDAVAIAVSPKGNNGIQLSAEAAEQARSRVAQSRAALLPDVSAAFSENSRMMNLAASGLKFESPLPGFSFPTVVGPFNVMDARLSARQTVFDFSAVRRLQAARRGASAARAEAEAAGEQVVAAVARCYMAAVRAEADVETAEADVTLSEAVQKQAENQKQAGAGTGIEITRARVQLASGRQRLVQARNARRAAYMQLLRVTGLPLDADVELTDKLEFVPVDSITLEEARKLAEGNRADLRAQRERETGARLAASAVKMERLPSVAAIADYGSSGSGLTHAVPTRNYGVSVQIPIFDGGRKDARRGEAESQYRAEKIRARDLAEQVELEVRLALDRLRSAEEEVRVASDGVGLAESELAQARRRYEAGVAGGLEVTDAQTRLERARDNRTAALYRHNIARIDLAEAMGKARELVR